jgi:hypothetical protein
MRFRSEKSIKARRAGTSLVAAFHKANPPLIWRFDLARNHSFTLLMQKEKDQWVLGLAPSENEFHAIARFTSHADAKEAFVAVEKILARRAYAWIGTMLKVFSIVLAAVFICALLFLGILWGAELMRGIKTAPAVNQTFLNGVQLPTQSPNGPAPAPAIKPGVPLPADEYLRPPP